MTNPSTPRQKARHRGLRILGVIVMVPVSIFALMLAATPFSQVARGVMFGIVFWDETDIEHIRVFPANDIPT